MTTMFSREVEITPELAADILAHRNHAGREISRDRVRRYLQEINEGRWVVSPQGVVFDGEDLNSHLIDGQHRLTAIKQSGQTQTVYATFNAPKESWRTFDQHLGRTGAQLAAVEISELEYDPESPVSRLSSAARIILEHGLGNPKPSNTMVALYTRDNVRVLDKFGRIGKLYKAGTHAAFAFAELSGMRGVEAAAQRLISLDWAGDGDPVKALMRALNTTQGQGARAQRALFFTTLAALEYVDRGEPLQVARKYEQMPDRVNSSIQLRSSMPPAEKVA